MLIAGDAHFIIEHRDGEIMRKKKKNYKALRSARLSRMSQISTTKPRTFDDFVVLFRALNPKMMQIQSAMRDFRIVKKIILSPACTDIAINNNP